MIEAEKLTKYYGDRTAVRDLTFQVGKGEIVGLLGPNGAGKTTTMRMLTGYLPLDGGRAIVAGYNVSDKPMEVRRRLGYLPETVPLYTDMPVNAYLDFTAKIRGVPGNGRKRRVQEVMELCRIADVSHKVIGKLSRGYKQRVGLAQAIIHNPQVIILDEPTVGLDPRQIIEIRKVIRDLAGNHSIVLSTHILPEVSALCDRVVIVNRGRVLVEDTLANLERRDTQAERLRLIVRGPAETIRQTLTEWPGVLEVNDARESGDIQTTIEEAANQTDVQGFELQIAPNTDLREVLAGMIISRGWGLLEIRTVAPTLEDIFVKLVNEDLDRLAEEEGEYVEDGGIETDEELDEGAATVPTVLNAQAADEVDPATDEGAVSVIEAVKPGPAYKAAKSKTTNGSKKRVTALRTTNLDDDEMDEPIPEIVQETGSGRKAAPSFLQKDDSKTESEGDNKL